MSNARILDTSIQRAREWLHDVRRGLGFDNGHTAYAVFRAKLHTQRDRLPAELIVYFGAGLAPLIRGIYDDGWHPSAARLPEADAEDILSRGSGSSRVTASFRTPNRWRSL